MDIARLLPRREDVIFLAYVAVIAFGATQLLARSGGPSFTFEPFFPNLRFYLIILIGFVCCGVPYLLLRYRPLSPIDFMVRSPEARAFWLSIMAGIPLLIAAGFFMPAFSLIKSGIPLFTEYSWDAKFIALDRAIHGTDAWRLLQPALGFPIVTAALAQLYHLWFLLIYVGTLYFAVMVKDRALRVRYFIAYFLMWTIGGMAMAVGFASVGPCFLHPLLGDATFTDQMAYLEYANQHYPVAVLEVQHELVKWFHAGDFGFGRGISAMPSMHVALAFLFFLAMRRVSKMAGWFFGAFCFVIMISSVHLGYHYAVDGYVSLILITAIWWLADKLTPLLLGKAANPVQAAEVGGVPAHA